MWMVDDHDNKSSQAIEAMCQTICDKEFRNGGIPDETVLRDMGLTGRQIADVQYRLYSVMKSIVRNTK